MVICKVCGLEIKQGQPWVMIGIFNKHPIHQLCNEVRKAQMFAGAVMGYNMSRR